MAAFLKATKVVNTSLGLLQRELTLPAIVWKDAAFDFVGAKDDTVSIRLPAYAPARTRNLRSGTRTKDSLGERKVDLTLSTDVYKDIGITDAQLSLDIVDFGAQVLNPVLSGIAVELENQVATALTGATYANSVTHTAASDDAYKTVLKARAFLNNAFVPFAGRYLVVGTDFEAALLGNDKFVNADKSGSTDSLREAVVGRVAGFTVVSSPAIPSNQAYAMHQTAVAMAQRAPIVPAGAPWGASQSYQGLAIRTVRVFDPDAVEDRFVADAWVGAKAVTDNGHFDADPAAGGKFVPVTDPDSPVTGQTPAWKNDTDKVVRAVKITVASS